MKLTHLARPVLATLVCLPLVACSEETTRAAEEAMDSFAQDLTRAKESGREDLEGFLSDTSDQLQIKIQELEQKARDAELDKTLDEALVVLKAKKELLDQRLVQLEAAGSAGWEELKDGAVNAAREAQKAWEAAAPEAQPAAEPAPTED